MNNAAAPTLTQVESRLSDYFALLKPKVMSLVVFTALAGMWVAPGFETRHPFLIFVDILCIAVGAGAAGAINMYYDRDIDAIMRRTASRPLPMGRIKPEEALTFGITLSFCSVLIMCLVSGWLAGGLLATANLFYVFVYTIWLKRLTPHNIVIGGAAGAFPPLIGWAAVTHDISLYPIIQFLIIFLWTPPHFWALSLFASDDYRRAGIPMLPVAKGVRTTKIQMLVYTLLLFPVTLAPWFLGYASAMYGIAAAVLSGFFIFTAIHVLLHEDLKAAKLMFGYSVFYLFALFLALMFG